MKNDYAKEAQKYEKYGLPTLATWVWEACVRRYGVGGTPESLRAYEKIMAAVFFELDLPSTFEKAWTGSCGAVEYKDGKPYAVCGVMNCQTHKDGGNKSL